MERKLSAKDIIQNLENYIEPTGTSNKFVQDSFVNCSYEVIKAAIGLIKNQSETIKQLERIETCSDKLIQKLTAENDKLNRQLESLQNSS